MGLKFVGYYKGSGWRGELPFYQWKCKDCGKLVIDYKHGFEGNEYVQCPICYAREW